MLVEASLHALKPTTDQMGKGQLSNLCGSSESQFQLLFHNVAKNYLCVFFFFSVQKMPVTIVVTSSLF